MDHITENVKYFFQVPAKNGIVQGVKILKRGSNKCKCGVYPQVNILFVYYYFKIYFKFYYFT